MNRTLMAVVLLFVMFSLVASAAPCNAPSPKGLAAVRDGSQPPVPPKMGATHARMLDGSQSPVPPKAATEVAWMLDGSQPPVLPKALVATV